MSNEELAVARVQWADATPAPLSGTQAMDPAQAAPRTSLEAERFGVLSGPATPVDGERRMEQWIASHLDFDPGPAATERSAWSRLIDGLPGWRQVRAKPRVEKTAEATLEGWGRFHVAYKRGITLVRLVDRALVRDGQIQELACDLLDLIEAGNQRIVLNFQAVERLASLVVVAVREAQALCAARDGGALKICGLRPDLAAVFPLTGASARVGTYADEATAIDSPWPEPSGPAPLPVEILTALMSSADIPPVRGGAQFGEAVRASDKAVGQNGPPPRKAAAPRPRPTPDSGIWLKVQIGGTKGRLVPVAGSRFVIGRDPSCQFRLGSPLVSKLHAALERRDGLVYMRDLGSTNGTIVNGRPLHGREVQIKDGDRIQIGPIVSTLLIGPRRPGAGMVEDMVVDWLSDETGGPPSDQADAQPTLCLSAFGEGGAESERRIKHEVIQDVLVVTPQVSALDEDEVIELLRAHLRLLLDQPMPRQVVVNLEYVAYLSGHAIGVLLAHHLRLDRAGGALRICQARARIMAVLHHVHLTMLVECHPTLDEAVLGAWPCAPKKSAADD